MADSVRRFAHDAGPHVGQPAGQDPRPGPARDLGQEDPGTQGPDTKDPDQGPSGSAAPRILHLTERALWEEARAGGAGYEVSTRGRTLGDVGFIHCSLPHQLPDVAALLYRDEPARDDLVVLTIDPARLDVPLRYEPPVPGAEPFPHIYGPLPLDAVVSVDPWHPTPAPGA